MMRVRLTTRKATSAANDDISARTFRSPIGRNAIDRANTRSAAAHGERRLADSAVKTDGRAPSRAIAKASRAAAMSEMRTVFAVANNAMALSTMAAPGHALWTASASGAALAP